jgi:actin-related protein
MIAGYECPGVGQIVFDCILKADAAVKHELFDNIILSGGTSMLAGFPTRI